MSFKLPNGTVRRNLEEQVLNNKDNILAHYEIDRTLADYGIKIIGFYPTIEEAVEDLGDPYEGPYGNAVGIGISAPYTFYIWTRANNLSAVDYWQDVGELAVVGPAGKDSTVPGPQGEAGRPAHIYTGNGYPAISASPNDIYMVTSGPQNMIGNIYQIVDGTWTLKGNIRGPQGLSIKGDTGERGPAFTFNDLTAEQKEQLKGDRGDPGGFIKISGILTDLGELPNPTVLQDLEVAYLYGTEAPYELWMQVGPNYEEAVWTNMGALNVATYVSVNGEFQNTWDADTKLDKITQPLPSGNYQLYAVDDEGSQTVVELTESTDPGTIVMRGQYGEIFVPEYPEFPNEAASKQYVDGLIIDSETISTYWEGPDLSLKLNPAIEAEIERSIKLPEQAPSTASFVRVKSDGTYDLSPTTTYLTAAAQAYADKTTTYTFPKKVGTTYIVVPGTSTSTNTSFILDIKQVGASDWSSVGFAQYVEIMPVSTGRAMVKIVYQPTQGSTGSNMVVLFCTDIKLMANTTSPARVYRTTWYQHSF